MQTFVSFSLGGILRSAATGSQDSRVTLFNLLRNCQMFFPKRWPLSLGRIIASALLLLPLLPSLLPTVHFLLPTSPLGPQFTQSKTEAFAMITTLAGLALDDLTGFILCCVSSLCLFPTDLFPSLSISDTLSLFSCLFPPPGKGIHYIHSACSLLPHVFIQMFPSWWGSQPVLWHKMVE